MNDQIEKIIARLDLKPHPEGGHYRETYRSEGVIVSQQYQGTRNYSTAIYYLLGEGEKSKFHRVRSDEIWHFYSGGPLELWEIDTRGEARQVILGQDIEAGQVLQHAVLGGRWFAATPLKASGYSLVGCTVAPGFNFSDFEIGHADDLRAAHPQHAGLIARFT